MNEREDVRIGWIAVAEVATLSEARVVVSLLESEGIDVRLDYDPAGSVILGPGSMNPFSGVSVWVPEPEAEKALRVLRDIPGNEAPEPPDVE